MLVHYPGALRGFCALSCGPTPFSSGPFSVAASYAVSPEVPRPRRSALPAPESFPSVLYPEHLHTLTELHPTLCSVCLLLYLHSFLLAWGKVSWLPLFLSYISKMPLLQRFSTDIPRQ